MIINTILAILATLGHIGAGFAVFNQIQATGTPRKFRKGAELVLLAGVPSIWFLCIYLLVTGDSSFSETFEFFENQRLAYLYAIFCWISGLTTILILFWRKWRYSNPDFLQSHTSETFNVAAELNSDLSGSGSVSLMSKIPGNQIFHLCVEVKEFCVENLPAGLEGLSITHLSDFHLTGDIKQEYFEFAIEKANAFGSDIVFITGDIIDKRVCIPWLSETLGKLNATLGVFYVLGNHDRRIQPVGELRETLNEIGFQPLFGEWKTIEHHGAKLHLCGNEMPWFKHARDLAANPEQAESEDFRVLLSHSPDQIYWAQRFNIDLMFAGHTHGGQIRLPWIGSLVAASKYGTAFACGSFRERDTILEVSRGVSGTQPLRLNCLPQITKVTLHKRNDT